MAVPKSNSKTRSKWQRIISAGEASGLTDLEYCERNGIHLEDYRLWKRKLEESGVELTDPDNSDPNRLQ